MSRLYEASPRAKAMFSKITPEIFKAREYGDPDRIKMGVRVFKRKTLGICGTHKEMPAEDLAKKLHELGMVDSLEEGVGALSEFRDLDLIYSATSSLRIWKFEDKPVYGIDIQLAMPYRF